jgi:Domain of unknown function (DUF5122) beta-propeller
MKRRTYGTMNANYRSIILAVSVFFALSVSTSAAPGELDPTFGNGGIALVHLSGYQLYFATEIAIQPDGKIVAVATASADPGTFGVVPYNPSGSLDTSFNGSGVVTTPFDNVESSEPLGL